MLKILVRLEILHGDPPNFENLGNVGKVGDSDATMCFLCGQGGMFRYSVRQAAGV